MGGQSDHGWAGPGETMSEFINMGGYAIFVWSSFGISLLVLLLNVILPAMRRKQLLRDVRSHIKRNRN